MIKQDISIIRKNLLQYLIDCDCYSIWIYNSKLEGKRRKGEIYREIKKRQIVEKKLLEAYELKLERKVREMDDDLETFEINDFVDEDDNFDISDDFFAEYVSLTF